MPDRPSLVLLVSVLAVTSLAAVGSMLSADPSVLKKDQVRSAIAQAPTRCQKRLEAAVTDHKGELLDTQYRRLFRQLCPDRVAYGYSSNGGFVAVTLPDE